MLKEFEEELIYKLDTSSTKVMVNSYLGEFEDMSEFEKCVKNTPLILVDFDSEKFINLSQKESLYKIHFVAATSNKSEQHRQNTKFELYNLIEKCDKTLQDAKLSNGFRIRLNNLKKFYEGVSDYGYLSIYTRQIVTTLAPLYKDTGYELTQDEINFLNRN